MAYTWIDILKLNGKITARIRGSPFVRIANHGQWKIDPEIGKSICLIDINLEKNRDDISSINFPPSDFFIKALLDKFLETEYQNNGFTFNKPVLETHRPTQLKDKLKSLQEILNKWGEKLNDRDH